MLLRAYVVAMTLKRELFVLRIQHGRCQYSPPFAVLLLLARYGAHEVYSAQVPEQHLYVFVAARSVFTARKILLCVCILS